MSSDTAFWPTIVRHIRKGHLRKAGTEILAGAVVLLIAGMILLGANISELHGLNQQVERSNEALLQVSEVDNMAIGVEFAVRGLALSGNPVFRKYHRDNDRNLRKAITRLATQTSDRPDQIKDIKSLRILIDSQIATYDRLAALGREDAPQIAAAIVDPKIRQTRDRLQRTLYDIRRRELAILRDRQKEAERRIRQTFVLSAGIVAMAFALAIIGLTLICGDASKPEERP